MKTAPRRLIAVVVVLASVGLVGLAAGAAPATTAAWSDGVTYRGAVDSGGWASEDPGDVSASDLGIREATSGTQITDVQLDVDETTGTISNPYWFCVGVDVTSRSGASEAWRITVDYTRAPFNGVSPSRWTFAPNGAATGKILADDGSVVTIGGAADVTSRSPFGSITWGWSSVTHNTPVAAGQTATVTFCLAVDSAHPAPVLDAVGADGSVAYTATAPSVVGRRGATPSAFYGCVTVEVTSQYPHVYIGYRLTVDWTQALADAVAAGEITESTRRALAARALRVWTSSPGGTITDVTSTTEASGHVVYRLSETGRSDSEGALGPGVTHTVTGCTS